MKKSYTPSFVIFFICIVLTLSKLMTPYMLVASAGYSLLLYGFRIRTINKRRHAKFMLSGITCDLLLVLLLEIQRNAVHTAISFTLSPLQQTHVLMSSIATVLYFPMIFIGLKLLKNPNPRLIKIHKKIGYTALFFRSLGFIFMFSLLKKVMSH